MPHVLRPGLHLVPRGPDRLSLVRPATGDAPLAGVTVPDTAAVRRLVDDLAQGRPTSTPDYTTRRALARIVAAGLTEPAAEGPARRGARTAARVLVDAPPGLVSSCVELLMAAGLAVTTRDAAATHVLLAACGEVDRRRLEPWVRRGVAHLLLVDHAESVTVGPFVAPGRTACVHCLDAHRADADPQLPDLLEAITHTPALATAAPVDAALRAAALGWAVRDLVSAVDGHRPSTWSATVTLRVRPETGLSVARRQWRRHLHCGCAWGDELTG